MIKISKYHISTLFILLVGCNSSSNSETPVTTPLSAFGEEAFPTEVTLSSPLNTGSSLAVATSQASFTVPTISPGTLSADSMKETLRTFLSTSVTAADCGLNIQLLNSSNATCYGPTADYTHHSNDDSTGSLPGGDLGIWQAEETATGEACASAQLNAKLKGSSSMIGASQLFSAAMACYAVVEGHTTLGDTENITLDHTAINNFYINGTPHTVSSATIVRTQNVLDQTHTTTYTLVASNGPASFEFRLLHTTSDTDTEDYTGKISVKGGVSDGSKPLNCSASTATGYTNAASLVYSHDNTGLTNVSARSGQFCGDAADPFTNGSGSNYIIDFASALNPGTLETGWANNSDSFVANYETTNAGSYTYAWQAGYGDGYSRALNVKLLALAASTPGFAFFGFGPDLRTETNIGKIDGMICNWAGPAPNKFLDTSVVQKQQILAPAGGIFASVAANITYDPVDSCESNSATFTFSGNSGVAFNYTMDTTTKDLAAFSDVSTEFGSLPTVVSGPE